MERKSAEISILGSTFTIQSEYDPRYMEEVIGYLKGKIREVQAATSTHDPRKITLLAALNLVDELFRTKRRTYPENGDDCLEIERIAERLIDKIDESLIEH